MNTPSGWRRRLAIHLAMALSAGLIMPGHAQSVDEAAAERQIKAAFIYKFAGYVEWPDDALGAPGTPFTIGVLGADAMAAELTQAVAGRTVQDRAVTVRKLKAGDPLGDVSILFVGRADTARLKALLATVPTRPMMVVTEAEGALAQGSTINFLLVDRRVRFEISLESAEKSGLRVSSRLLAVAYKVHSGGS